MAVNYNETANTLKSKAENMTQLMQQQPTLQLNQSRRHIRHQMSRARMCRVMARNTLKMVKHIAELKCTADGNYERTQCESSGKWCWCVNENGMRVGSMKPLKKLNCSSTVKGGNWSFKKICNGKQIFHLSLDQGQRMTHLFSQNLRSNQARISYDLHETWTLARLSSDNASQCIVREERKTAKPGQNPLSKDDSSLLRGFFAGVTNNKDS